MTDSLEGTVALVTGASSGIADAIGYIVTRRRHVAVNEVLVRPTTQV